MDFIQFCGNISPHLFHSRFPFYLSIFWNFHSKQIVPKQLNGSRSLSINTHNQILYIHVMLFFLYAHPHTYMMLSPRQQCFHFSRMARCCAGAARRKHTHTEKLWRLDSDSARSLYSVALSRSTTFLCLVHGIQPARQPEPQ